MSELEHDSEKLATRDWAKAWGDAWPAAELVFTTTGVCLFLYCLPEGLVGWKYFRGGLRRWEAGAPRGVKGDGAARKGETLGVRCPDEVREYPVAWMTASTRSGRRK